MNFVKNEFVGTWKGFSKEKIKPMTLLLVVVNIVCLLVSNIIASKTFTLFTINDFTVTLPVAVILYPIVLTISDLLANYDYVWTRRSCHLGFILNLLMVGAFTVAIYIPGVLNNAPDQGSSGAMNGVLGSTWFMLIASMTSFYFGDLVNDLIFKRLLDKDGETNKITFRCVLSTFFGQLVDSSIFITLGMHVLPKAVLGFAFMSWSQVGIAICFQVLVKVLYELLLSPVIVLICKKMASNKEEVEIESKEEIIEE